MTRGVFEHEGTKYCLVPTKRPNQGAYWPGGPTLANPVDTNRRLIDPAGRPVPKAVAVFEEDLWIPHDRLTTIRGWPVYPFTTAAFGALPPRLADRLFEGTFVHPPNAAGEVGVEVTWDELRISRVFKLIQLGAGAAVWPPKALPDWKYFYFLFATGDAKLVDKRTEIFADLAPVVYGYTTHDQPRQGETRVTRFREAAYCRIDIVPKWITFESLSDRGRTHGILPICVAPTGEFGMLDRSGRGRSSFATPVAPRRSATHQAAIRLSVDFGTSNTAVAVRGQESTGLLPWDSGTRAVNLTSTVNLDPTLKHEYANRFFAVGSTYSNPLPTILFESHDVDVFSGTDAIPVRAIPEFGAFTREQIQAFAGERYLKQDFKWKPSDESAVHRRAYLEQLAVIVGWALRTSAEFANYTDVDVVFSCPLAFTPGQTTRFKSTVEAFLGGLRSSGLTTLPMRSLVSESLANLCFVRENRPAGRFADTERHVVIDIGGGTTDISVFTGKGKTLLLDSLYIGGKDIASSLLYYRIDQQQGWAPVAKALGLIAEKSPAQLGKTAWVEMAQCLLINRMATDIGLLADDLSHEMPDLLPEILTLLTFVTLYSIRMAALGIDETPKATSIHVWFAGLGSRLFRLAPLPSRQMNREESARKILARAAARCDDLKGIDLTFHLGSYSKESVCRGALLAAPESGFGDDLHISTVSWADVPSAHISWHDSYDAQKVRALTDPQIKELQTETLSECYDISVRTVGELTLDRFDPGQSSIPTAMKDIADAYARACSRIQDGGDEVPRHPVRLVTDRIKESVCEIID